MENLNNQGKTDQQYKDNITFYTIAIIGLALNILCIIFL
jgi:hypothetical protein